MLSFFLACFTTLFTIVNPMGAVGPFLAMTLNETESKRRGTALRASIVSGGVLAFSAAVGAFVFKFYGITLPALKIAGGVLLFFVAFDMLNARPSRSKQTQEEEAEGTMKEDVAVFPLAIPLLSGPGAIVSVFILTDKASTLEKHLGLYAAILVSSLLVYFVLREAHRVVRILGQIGVNVTSRLMGLVLASIAMQFIIDGLRAALPALAN
jgi:multiple antibiotic resistance protein